MGILKLMIRIIKSLIEVIELLGLLVIATLSVGAILAGTYGILAVLNFLLGFVFSFLT